MEELISDAEREQAVEWLRDDLLAGRLTLEEFSKRVGRAYSARVRRQLEQPEISVRAMSLFGSVDVWRVPADMSGDYGEIFRQLQPRQAELPP